MDGPASTLAQVYDGFWWLVGLWLIACALGYVVYRIICNLEE